MVRPTKVRMTKVVNFTVKFFTDGYEQLLLSHLEDNHTYFYGASLSKMMAASREGENPLNIQPEEAVWALMGYTNKNSEWGALKAFKLTPARFSIADAYIEILKERVADASFKITFVLNGGIPGKYVAKTEILTDAPAPAETASPGDLVTCDTPKEITSPGGFAANTWAKMVTGTKSAKEITSPSGFAAKLSEPAPSGAKQTVFAGTVSAEPISDVVKTLLTEKMNNLKRLEQLKKEMEEAERAIRESALAEQVMQENILLQKEIEEMESKLSKAKAGICPVPTRTSTPASDIESLVSEMEASGERWSDSV